MNKKLFMLSTTIFSALVAVSVTKAQETAQSGAAASSPPSSTSASGPLPTGLEEIVVTATKREERLLKVPLSVSAITGKALEVQSAEVFQDYLPTIPGVQGVFAQPGETRLIVRGINSGGLSAASGIYIDETPYGSSSNLASGALTTPDLDTFDIQRIEVLRGPQGTLYGASTLGGLLKFVTNQPQLDVFDARGTIPGERDPNVDTGRNPEGPVKFPPRSEAAFRVSLYNRFDPGYVDDLGSGRSNVNYLRTLGGRAAFLWAPTDDLSVKLSAVLQNQTLGSSSDIDLLMDAPGHLAVPFQLAYGDYQQKREIQEPLKNAIRLYNGTVNWDFDWANLVSSTSYATYDVTTVLDESGTALGDGEYFSSPLNQRKITQEVRLASQNSDTLDWIGGVFYTDEEARSQANIGVLPVNHNFFPTTGYFVLNSSYQEIAGFASATYHITPTLDIAAGGRYAYNMQDGASTTDTLTNLSKFGLPNLASYSHFVGTSSEGVFTYSVAPAWHITPDMTVYARVAKGYRPGGPNIQQPGLPFPAVTHADTLINYETGFKGSFLDNTLSINADLFLIDWSNIQLLEFSGSFSGTVNGGNARSEGLEWSTAWTPIAGLQLGFNGSYDMAYLEDAAPAAGGYKGSALAYVPRWQTSFTADYKRPIPFLQEAQGYTGLTWNFVGPRYSDLSNAVQQVKLPSYNTVDLRAGVEYPKWSVELFVKNVADERGINTILHNFSAFGGGVGEDGGYSLNLVQPRTIGLTVRVGL